MSSISKKIMDSNKVTDVMKNTHNWIRMSLDDPRAARYRPCNYLTPAKIRFTIITVCVNILNSICLQEYMFYTKVFLLGRINTRGFLQCTKLAMLAFCTTSKEPPPPC